MITEQQRYRYRLSFHKTEAMRFTGHLDLYRTLERTIRRAGLPLTYRGGFSPHPRLQLAAALPLGFVSRAELADIWLDHPIEAAEVLARLKSAAPPGLQCIEVRTAIASEPALQGQVVGATYAVTLGDPSGAGDLADRVRTLLSSPAIHRERRGKSYDLRPLIEGLLVEGSATLLMRLDAREGATGRPDEVLEALGFDPLEARIERTSLVVASAGTA